MSNSVIGTCSLCGGAVCVPIIWNGIIPPTPRCNMCGAVACASGPVIPMQKLPQTFTTKLDCAGVDGAKIGITTNHT